MKKPSTNRYFNSQRLRVTVGVLVLASLVLLLLIWPFQQNRPWKGFKVPDENKAAQLLLAQKLSGPRYFKPGQGAADLPFPFITPATAKQQLARVIQERHLDPADRGKLENLIEQLVELPPSRLVGSERINVLRLNLALDEMP